MIDPYGRIRARLDLGLRGFLDVPLPVAVPVTPFARFGNVILLALILLCVAAALWPHARNQS